MQVHAAAVTDENENMEIARRITQTKLKFINVLIFCVIFQFRDQSVPFWLGHRPALHQLH